MLNFYIKEKENKMMKNETGRSMVEMLGVLAIIGVLSVGGIAGYTMAMRKYKANEILNTASMLAVLAKSSNGGAGLDGTNTLDVANAGLDMPAGASAMSINAANEVSITGESSDLCNTVEAAASTDPNLYTVNCTTAAARGGE